MTKQIHLIINNQLQGTAAVVASFEDHSDALIELAQLNRPHFLGELVSEYIGEDDEDLPFEISTIEVKSACFNWCDTR